MGTGCLCRRLVSTLAPSGGSRSRAFSSSITTATSPSRWQVALIIDTSRHASLLYRWEGSEARPLRQLLLLEYGAEPVASCSSRPFCPDERRIYGDGRNDVRDAERRGA